MFFFVYRAGYFMFYVKCELFSRFDRGNRVVLCSKVTRLEIH